MERMTDVSKNITLAPKLHLLVAKTEKDGESLNGFNLRVFVLLALRVYPFTQMYRDSCERGISGQFEAISCLTLKGAVVT